MIIQQEIYSVFNIIKIIINSLEQIYEEKEIRLFLNKLILKKNQNENDASTRFFIADQQKNTILNFSLGLFNVTELYRQWDIKNY